MKDEKTKEMLELISVAKVLFATELLKERLTVKLDVITHFELITYNSVVLEKIKEIVKIKFLILLVAIFKNDNDTDSQLICSLLNFTYFRQNEGEMLNFTKEELLKTIIIPYLSTDDKYISLIDLIVLEADIIVGELDEVKEVEQIEEV